MENLTSSRRGRPPISNQVIRVGGAIALPALLRERGIDADALIAEVGLQAAFHHPDNVIPFAKLGGLTHIATARTGLPDLGLRACMRPVLMTSAAAVLALLPAALGLGAGAETNQPLSVAVIGGMISSTLLTLVVVPAVYSLVENHLAQRAWKRRQVSGEG